MNLRGTNGVGKTIELPILCGSQLFLSSPRASRQATADCCSKRPSQRGRSERVHPVSHSVRPVQLYIFGEICAQLPSVSGSLDARLELPSCMHATASASPSLQATGLTP